MNSTHFVILISIAIVVVLLIIVIYFNLHPDRKKDTSYLNENGDHIYYERSIIEKKEFLKTHPNAKDVRTLRAIFHCHKRDNAGSDN